MIPRSGTHLHRSILNAAMRYLSTRSFRAIYKTVLIIVRAPMSFFTKTETGVLVNRYWYYIR